MDNELSNKNDKVLVLLAAFNGRRWLAEQVESVFCQIKVDLEIVVSIDPSADGTEQIFSSLSKQYPDKMKVLPMIGRFGSAAPNFFRLIRDADFSGFDYIAFADQDDIWHDIKLSRAINALQLHSCDGYSSNVTAFWPSGNVILIDKAQPQREWDYLFESAGPGCTFVLTKTLALELQEFIYSNYNAMSDVWLHDWFTYAYARSNGYKWYIDKKPSMLYRQHEENQVGVNAGYKALIKRSRYVLSGKALEQASIIATLCDLKGTKFVRRWHGRSRFGVLRLAFDANSCRRKFTQRILFVLLCLTLFIIGNRKICEKS